MVIYKYKIPFESTKIQMPNTLVKILSAESQGNDVVVYGLIDKNITGGSATDEYEFIVMPTGQETEVNLGLYTFLNTVKLLDGVFMFHVFYRKL